MHYYPRDLKSAIRMYGLDYVLEFFPDDMQEDLLKIRGRISKPVFILDAPEQ